MKKADFEKSFRVATNALMLSGVKITNANFGKWGERFYNVLYFFNLFWLYMNAKGKPFIEITISTPLITLAVLVTVKTTFLLINKNTLATVVNKLKELHPDDADIKNQESDEKDTHHEYNADEKLVDEDKSAREEILKDTQKLLNFFINLFLYVCLVLTFCFIAMPLFLMAYEYFTTGTTDYKYIYLAKYFFDINNLKQYIAMYINHIWATFIVTFNITGTNIMLYVICIYIQMHFRLLCHRLENIVSESAEKMRQDLVEAVRRHQDLIALVDQLELLYSKSMLFNMLTSSFLICLSGLIATMLKDFTVVVNFLLFLLMSLLQIYLLCYFGDMIMQSSNQVSTAVYHSLWYEADQRAKKTMLIILLRAQKPCKLTAYNVVDINLAAYTSILSRSWSYFAVLRSMYE